MTAGRATAEVADDLRDATADELRFLLIETTGPSVWVDLFPIEAQVWTYSDSDQARALADDAARLLNERRMGRFTRHLLEAMFLIPVPMVLIGRFLPPPVRLVGYAGFLVMIVVGVMVVLGKLTPPLVGSGAVIIPERRGERRRHRRDIALWVLGGLLAIGLTYWQVSASGK